MGLKEKIIIQDRDHLEKTIKNNIKLYGNKVDLNHLDVSSIIDMSHLFYHASFNGQINQWDVSKVENMQFMFANSKFNQDISNWDMSKVKDMTGLFFESQFNQNISNWNVSSVEKMGYMFYKSLFKKDLTLWTPLSLENSLDIFNNSICPKPYWADCSNNEELKQKITEFQQSYQLKQKLEQELVINHPIKKLKL